MSECSCTHKYHIFDDTKQSVQQKYVEITEPCRTKMLLSELFPVYCVIMNRYRHGKTVVFQVSQVDIHLQVHPGNINTSRQVRY